MAEERVLAVKQNGACRVMALKLVRYLDAVGAGHYSMTVALCLRAPNGLVAGMLQGGTQQYCVRTYQQTQDMGKAKGKGYAGPFLTPAPHAPPARASHPQTEEEEAEGWDGNQDGVDQSEAWGQKEGWSQAQSSWSEGWGNQQRKRNYPDNPWGPNQ